MKQEQIFSKDFLNLDYKAVTKELNEKGYRKKHGSISLSRRSSRKCFLAP